MIKNLPLLVFIFLIGCNRTLDRISDDKCPTGLIAESEQKSIFLDEKVDNLAEKTISDKVSSNIQFSLNAGKGQTLMVDTKVSDLCVSVYDPNKNKISTTLGEKFNIPEDGDYLIQVNSPLGERIFNLDLKLSGKRTNPKAFLPLQFKSENNRYLQEVSPNSSFDQPLVAEVDLNNDGKNEIIISANPDKLGQCGNGGCSIVAYTKKESQWQDIFSTLSLPKLLGVKNSSKNGFKEIIETVNTNVQRIYSFNGSNYVLSSYQDRRWQIPIIQGYTATPDEGVSFYTEPSPNSISKETPRENVYVLGQTGEWMLVNPCPARVCEGTFYYLPSSKLKQIENTEISPAISSNTDATISGDPRDYLKNIRSGYSTDYPPIFKLPIGSRVKVIEGKRNSDNYLWYRIYSPDKQREGWIASQLITLDPR
jgi:hypothetical protein